MGTERKRANASDMSKGKAEGTAGTATGARTMAARVTDRQALADVKRTLEKIKDAARR
ncbi:hypothetical protein [Kitasatospora purpeofusca]|uniref:hypothetical protein n=1 Tax=Kitasatospora purpeofusca TaxID=67352 RepID=UPI002A5A02F6|nr:hypothetical protein [Kitasatospora purpeofusca]MDY0810861.1 hypothetical protein [Kitasatospora purpeofusca]